jgi:hypothetical protein
MAAAADVKSVPMQASQIQIGPDTRYALRVPRSSRLVPSLRERQRQGTLRLNVEMFLLLEGNTLLAKLATKPNSSFGMTGAVFHLSLSVGTTAQDESFVFLHEFYSRLQKDASFASIFRKYANPIEQQMLPGMGASAFCFVIRNLLERKWIQSTSMIVLEASGKKITSPNPDQVDPGLIPYYMKLGFRFPEDPAKLYENIRLEENAKIWSARRSRYNNWMEAFQDAGYVPMLAPVQVFLEHCKATAKHVF